MSEEVGFDQIAAILKAEGIVRFLWKPTEKSAMREVLITMHTPRLRVNGVAEPVKDYIIGIRRLNMVALSRGVPLDEFTATRFFGGVRSGEPPKTDMPLSDIEVRCFLITVNMIRAKAEALASGQPWESGAEATPDVGLFTLTLPE